MGTAQDLDEKLRRESSTDSTKARRTLASLEGSRGYRVLVIRIAQMAGESRWRWVSGNGKEAIFEIEGE